MRLIDRRFPRAALAAPQIDAVAELQRELRTTAVFATDLFADQGFGQLQAGVATGHRQAGATIGLRSVDTGLHPMQARVGRRKAGAVLQALGNQRVQLRIAQGAPPIAGRPRGRAQRGLLRQGALRMQPAGIQHATLRG